MTARGALLALLLAASGCASPPTSIEIPREVKIPVPVPCVDEPVDRPAFVTDGELAAMDDYALIISLAADRLARQQYGARLEAVIAGCR